MVNRRYNKRRSNARSKKTLVKMVKNVVNSQIENKYQTYDLQQLGGISSSGSLINVNLLSSGAGQSFRVGNRVKFTSLRFKGVFGFADSDNVIRMLVLWSRAPLSVSNMPTVYNPINPAEQNYKLLYDKTVVTDSNASSGIRYISIPTVYRKINGNSTYDGSVSTPTAGFLYFYFVSDSTVTSHPTFTGQAIMSYQDA